MLEINNYFQDCTLICIKRSNRVLQHCFEACFECIANESLSRRPLLEFPETSAKTRRRALSSKNPKPLDHRVVLEDVKNEKDEFCRRFFRVS